MTLRRISGSSPAKQNTSKTFPPRQQDARRPLAIDGVAEAAPVLAGFPSGCCRRGYDPGLRGRSDLASGGLPVWNVVDGDSRSLLEQGTLAIDRFYAGRLACPASAHPEIRGEPVVVGAVDEGIRSFTTMPYVFSNIAGARSYLGLPANYTTHFRVRLKPGADLDVRAENILVDPPRSGPYPSEFSDQSRSFWLLRTGAGAALVAGAILR